MAAAEGEEKLEDEMLLAVLRSNAASLLVLRAWQAVDSGGGSIYMRGLARVLVHRAQANLRCQSTGRWSKLLKMH